MSRDQPGSGGPHARGGVRCRARRADGGRAAGCRRARRARALFRPRRRDAAAAVRRGGAAGQRRDPRPRRLRPPASLPALRHRPARAVRRSHRRRRRSGSCAGSSTRSGISASSSAIRCGSSTTSPGSKPTTRSFCSRCSMRVRSPAPGSLFDRFNVAVSHARPPTRYILTSLLQLIEERHAAFNATLYQLEPDVKEAPGALRDLAATRTIALLTDPLLLRRGPADPARFDDAEDFLLRVRSTLHLEAGRNQNVLSHEHAGTDGGSARLSGRRAAPARRAADERLLPPRAHRRRSLEWARKTAPVPVGPNLGLSRDGIRFLDPIQAARKPSSWIGAFQAAIDAGTEVTEEALSCIQQHVDRYRADDFFPDGARPRGAARAAQAAGRRSTRGCRRCTTAGCWAGCFRSSRRSPGAWCATSTTSTPVDEHTLLTIRNLERLSTTDECLSAALPQRHCSSSPNPSCWSSRCCCTTSGSGATTITRTRACGWRGTWSTACSWPARRARRCCS